MTADKERLIYQTPDSLHSYDPLALRRRLLLASKNKLNEWVSLYNDGTDEIDRLTAEENLVAVARQAFELKPVTESGGTCDAAVLETLAHFLEWLSGTANMSTGPSPIDRPCTDCAKKLTTEQSAGLS